MINLHFNELKLLLKMMQACVRWKVKLYRFLHASGMFQLKTLSELCKILHTPGMSFTKDIKRVVYALHTFGMSLLKTLRELHRFYTLLV